MNAARLTAVLVACALPSLPLAHGVSHQVERRGATFAVRARYHGGGPLAGATYQVLRPGQPDAVWREGRTDAQGWVEFVPDARGIWRVRIADASGHGAVVKVEVTEVALPAPAGTPASAVPPTPAFAPAPQPAASTAPSPTPAPAGDSASASLPTTLLRAVAGALAIGLAFAALRGLHRRRRPGR